MVLASVLVELLVGQPVPCVKLLGVGLVLYGEPV